MNHASSMVPSDQYTDPNATVALSSPGNNAAPSDERQRNARTAQILFIDPLSEDEYVPRLREHFEVTTAASEEQALRALRCAPPTLIITELALAQGDGLSICRQAKAMASAPSVLVVTSIVERAADALIAQCDGILLKPFAPSLLYNRIGRLLRQRAKPVRETAMWQRAEAAYLVERAHDVIMGTNIAWSDVCCPSCGHSGAVSFDAVDRRRMWFACMPCREVWLGPRRERQHQ